MMPVISMRKFAYDSRAGVTLTELIVVFGIMGMLAAYGMHALSLYRHTIELNDGAENAMSALVTARTNTLSSQGAMQYGVHFAGGSTTLFVGSAYASGATGNVVTALPAAVEASAIALSGGGADIVFKRFTGETDQYGTITLRLTSDPAQTRVVNILASGAIWFGK